MYFFSLIILAILQIFSSEVTLIRDQVLINVVHTVLYIFD